MNGRTTAAAFALAVAVSVHVAAPASAAPISIGTAMPAVTADMKNVDGKTMTLAGLHGEKGTLIVFSCNHCPFAKRWESRIVALGNEYSQKGIAVAVLNSNDPAANADDSFENMQTRAKAAGMTFPYLCDPTSAAARAYGAEHTPEAFLFDKSGHLVYHGAIDDNANDASQVSSHWLADALAAVATGHEVAMKETKALGCSIKYCATAQAPANKS